MGKSQDFLTPRGRLVQGDCFTPQTKNSKGEPLVVKSGPNAGQPTQKFFVAVAFPKTDAAFAAIKAQFEQVGRAAFPQFFPNGGPCINNNFSWKIIDGDGYDENGKPNNTKEGFAGHWVLRASSSFPPKCYQAGKYDPSQQLQDPKSIPRGHYVRISGTVSDNIPSQTPGLYVNLQLVSWECIGDLITSGPDASQVFGGGTSGASVGGVASIIMTAAANGVSYDAYKQQGWTDDVLIAQGLMIAPAPAAMAPPSPQAAPAPLPPQTVIAPPPPSAIVPHTAILTGPQMTAAANGVPYAEYQKQGWTDVQLINGGLMLPPTTAPAPLPSGGSVAPPPPVMTAPAPPPTGKTMLPAANGVPYSEYQKQGWSDAQLVQNGLMAA